MRFLLFASITGFIIITSCKNNFRCLDKYNKDELSFFSQTGFTEPQDILLKWDDSIKIGVKGKPTNRDLEIIDTIIKEMAPLMGSIKFKLVDVNENFRISFTNKCHLGDYRFGVVDYDISLFPSRHIKNIDMWINSNLKNTIRESTIRHEFLHGLGLSHPQSRNTGTMIESRAEYNSFEDYEAGMIKQYKYAALDKACIEILYSSCMPTGLSKRRFIKYINGHSDDKKEK